MIARKRVRGVMRSLDREPRFKIKLRFTKSRKVAQRSNEANERASIIAVSLIDDSLLIASMIAPPDVAGKS
jgi:hypothetical protein